MGKGARVTGDTRPPGSHSPLDCSSVTPSQVTSTDQDQGLNLEQLPSKRGVPRGLLTAHSSPDPSQPWGPGPMAASQPGWPSARA